MKLYLAGLLLLLLLAGAYASNATAVYSSTTGACGINCPKYRVWSNISGTWGSETELGTTTLSNITEARVYFSPVNQKRIVVTENVDGELDLYVSWNGIEWNQTRNITDLWTSAPATHYRGYDVGFESATGDALLIFAVNTTDTACDLAYFDIPAGGLANNSSYVCIDDSGIGTDVVYWWVNVDSDPVSSSSEIIAMGFDFTSNDASAWVWDGSAWANQQEISTAVTYPYESNAVKYAADGSKAFVLAPTGTAGLINGYYWGGSSWTAANPGDLHGSTQDACWLTLKSDPNSASLMLTAVYAAACAGTTSLLQSAYWSGAGWTLNTTDIDGGADALFTRPIDFAWNGTASKGRWVWDTDTTGTTLSNESWSWNGNLKRGATTTFSSYAGTGAWIQMARNPTPSDTVRFIGLRLNSNFDIGAFSFSGTAGGSYTNFGDSAMTASTPVTAFEAMGLAFVLAIDTTGPTVSGTALNETSVATNSIVCVSATVTDQNSVPVEVWAQIRYPSGTYANVTLSDTGCGAGVAGDGYYGMEVPVGPTGGTLTVNTTFANDSFGNMGEQAPWPQLNVTVASLFVDTSISTNLLNFGPLDPGSADNPAIENPVVLTNTANSNTAVDVYLNNTNMTYTSYWINATNLSVWTSNVPASATHFTGTAYLNDQIPNTGFYENLAVSTSIELYFWHDVPAGQAQGDYTSVVRVHSVADGQVP